MANAVHGLAPRGRAVRRIGAADASVWGTHKNERRPKAALVVPPGRGTPGYCDRPSVYEPVPL